MKINKLHEIAINAKINHTWVRWKKRKFKLKNLCSSCRHFNCKIDSICIMCSLIGLLYITSPPWSFIASDLLLRPFFLRWRIDNLLTVHSIRLYILMYSSFTVSIFGTHQFVSHSTVSSRFIFPLINETERRNSLIWNLITTLCWSLPNCTSTFWIFFVFEEKKDIIPITWEWKYT